MLSALPNPARGTAIAAKKVITIIENISYPYKQYRIIIMLVTTQIKWSLDFTLASTDVTVCILVTSIIMLSPVYKYLAKYEVTAFLCISS